MPHAGATRAWPVAALEPAAIDLRGVVKTYGHGDAAVTALDGVTLRVAEGGFCALTGPSGGGKTTLLNLVAGIDRPSAGRILVAGTDLSRFSDDECGRWRQRTVGVVFQCDTLLGVLTAIDNVELPLRLSPLSGRERRARAFHALERVGLEDRSRAYPRELCADERQRLAIARAIAGDPPVLVADEPTRHLDAGSVRRIVALLGALNVERGRTLLVSTREFELASRADQVYRLP